MTLSDCSRQCSSQPRLDCRKSARSHRARRLADSKPVYAPERAAGGCVDAVGAVCYDPGRIDGVDDMITVERIPDPDEGGFTARVPDLPAQGRLPVCVLPQLLLFSFSVPCSLPCSRRHHGLGTGPAWRAMDGLSRRGG